MILLLRGHLSRVAKVCDRASVAYHRKTFYQKLFKNLRQVQLGISHIFGFLAISNILLRNNFSEAVQLGKSLKSP